MATVASNISSGAGAGSPTSELAGGLRISQVVKGCWQLSGGHGGESSSNRTSGKAALDDFQAFVDAGITTFDTADIYGPSEELIGKYLKQPAADPAHLQVLTKFCVFGSSLNAADNQTFVQKGIDGSRRRLGVEALDLVQLYWHDYGVRRYASVAQRLAECQAAGVIKALGVTNFDVPRLTEIVDSDVRIASNQVQYSLLDRRVKNGMLGFCAQHGIALLPYGTTAGGFLSDRYRGVAASKVAPDTYSKSKYAAVIREAGGWTWFQGLLDVLAHVGARHGVSIANVAQRWVLQRPQVAAIIVGARNASHVADHRKLFTFSLSEDDISEIAEVLDRGRAPSGDCYAWERGGVW